MIVPSQRMLWAALIAGVPLAAVAGLAPAWSLPCALALGAAAAIAIGDAVFALRKLDRITARVPEFIRLTKGVPATLPVTIDNGLARPMPLRLGLILPAGVESEKIAETAIAPPGTSRIEWPCSAVARGDHLLREAHLEIASGLGLWQARGTRAAVCELRVYPNLRDRATASLFLKQEAGLRLRRQVGKGREFDNLRHYLPGDSFEDIHWKATARRGFPIVKLYRVEHAQEVYAVIDASRLSAREGIIEGYVDAALHLALVAERQGDRFGLVTFSDHTKKLIRARNGLEHFRLCRETIYNLQAERVSPDFGEVFASLQTTLRRRSLLVFFTSLDDALLAETFEREVPLIARRHLVLVNVTETADLRPLFAEEPPGDLDAVYAGLAGQMRWNRMRTLALALQNRGVRLTLAAPGRIRQQVAAEYLDIKRRQLL